MTKNPYSSAEIGPLMRDVKNKICHQLDLLGLLEDDYGMELLVAGNIISLDLSIAQVYEQVWKKSSSQPSSAIANSTLLSSSAGTASKDCPPMTVTYRLQVCLYCLKICNGFQLLITLVHLQMTYFFKFSNS